MIYNNKISNGMKVAIDISPLNQGNYLHHRVRGTGSYINGLRQGLTKYYPKNKYIFFNQGEKLSKDIDLIHYPYFEPFFLTLPLKKTHKTVVTVHDLTPLVFKDKFPSGIKGGVRWAVQKRLLQMADAVITDSISSKKDIEKFTKISPSKIHVVYLAADEKFKKLEIGNWKLEIQKRYGLPESFLLYVGDATWNKNLPNLIKAVGRTRHHLVIVGKAFKNEDFDKSNPWNQSLAEAQTLAKLNKKVIVLGFLNSNDLAKIYKSATAFIMPSFYEGFGLPVLEAMASGVPVITSNTSSLKEIGKDAVYYVDPEKSGKINGTLIKKGIKRSKQFSLKKTIDETIKVYDEIINKK